MNDQNITVETQEQKPVNFLVVGLFLLLMTVIAVTALYLYKNKEKNNNYQGKNPVILLKSDKKAGPLISQLETTNTKEVFNSLDTLSKTETDKNKAEVLKLYAASSLVSLDRNAGADYYIKIANDTTNSNLNRAYAMTQIAQYASGDANPELLKVFFSDATSTKKMSQDEIALVVNKKILELYPMNIALAKVARLELKKNPSKVTAQAMYNTYMPQIASTTKFFDQNDGLSHFTPQAYLATAQFLRNAETYGVSTTTEVRSYFGRAYTSSLAFHQDITKQFIMFNYLDYLLSKKLQDDARSLMTKLAAESMTQMVSTNLRTTHGSGYPSIVSFVSQKNATSTEFIKKWELLVK